MSRAMSYQVGHDDTGKVVRIDLWTDRATITVTAESIDVRSTNGQPLLLAPQSQLYLTVRTLDPDAEPKK